jgi:rRNA maturation RNase YbeY
MAEINFFKEDVTFTLREQSRLKTWIRKAFRKEKRRFESLNYIFCSDTYLLQLNKQYLRHNTFTDIITFDTRLTPEELSADIYISVERVLENAHSFQSGFQNELKRVIIHGALHIMGYSDKSQAEKSIMRKKEDAYLSLWPVSRETSRKR